MTPAPALRNFDPPDVPQWVCAVHRRPSGECAPFVWWWLGQGWPLAL